MRDAPAWPRLLVAVAPTAAALVVLALLGSAALVPSMVAIALGAAAAVLLRRFVPVYGPLLAALPLMAVLGLLAATVDYGAATEAVAGLAGLGILAWIGLSDAATVRRGGLLDGVLVPALGLGIALSVSLLLPVARQSVGVAAILLVATLGLLAWAVLSTAPEPGTAEVVPPSL
jgi:hypothetical protein